MQRLNCAPGDLAIVIKALLPENIGQIVEVLGVREKPSMRLNGTRHVWWVSTASSRKTLFYSWPDGKVRGFDEGPVFDHCLRRLCDPPWEEITDSQARTPADQPSQVSIG
jgi:hypothetical protein